MQIFNYDLVDSTQDLAKKYLENNSKIAAFVANGQTSGYGKQGRYFYSPANTGIYLSVAVPNFVANQDKIGLLTPCIATKVVEVLQSTFPQKRFELKWVNDIYLNGKKVAGILTEEHIHGLVVGIGINVNTEIFPKSLSQIASNITNTSFEKEKLVQHIINAILSAIKEYGQGLFLADYRHLSNVLGRRVELKIGKKFVSGIADDFDDQGRIVLNILGKKKHYSSGEITKVNLK